ncbi:serine/threonine-protein kinase [Marinibactrum halimedae]|uniref:Protein kinase domain-containing protein n=1 Tax=Marinibactrum halimedae TaxID=1444977 RepID=A0AA37WJZ2_9GAMM|nr:serine/threonine-protein kinase [Marinibactrum halimedae]MCD9459715.1 protein kinase [Marinibactrum halimedae]GLS24528.1 hypothetical protein GCM10007877_02400 [Marinibactrum halimedae]
MPLTYSGEQWKKMDALLDNILRHPEDEWGHVLERLVKKEDETYQEIKKMLDLYRKEASLLEAITGKFFQSKLKISSPSWIGTASEFTFQKIGPYRISGTLGQGGMGVVFLGERDDGEFEQKVAIKVLNKDSQAQSVLARFQREKQVLATLNHPNIARFYDGGVTEKGFPYFIMEYVEGVRIDEYCQSHSLCADKIFSLLLQLVDALFFAHSHLVVHRDIKPSNILVTEEGVLKLLDFGIAKLVGDHDQVNETTTAEQVLTPGVAAPEQIKNETITVATDVYQVGIVTYQLFCQKHPYAHCASSLARMVETICTQSPDPPSWFFSFSIASDKRKDIDAIILKMLRNDPLERYESMSSLRQDFIAYLNNTPIAARGDALSYRARKFVQTHWRGLLVSAAFVMLLVSYAVTVTVQRHEISKALQISEVEQKKSQQVSEFLTGIFKAADPNVSGLDVITAQDLLERGEQRILNELHTVPAVQAHLLSLFGEIYHWQGDYAESVRYFESAVHHYDQIDVITSLSQVKATRQLAESYMRLGQNDKAEALIDQLEWFFQIYTLPENESETRYFEIEYAVLLGMKGNFSKIQGNFLQSEQLLQEAVSHLRGLYTGQEGDAFQLSISLNNLALVQLMLGKFDEAVENINKAIQLQSRNSKYMHVNHTVQFTNLALALIDMEMFDEAMQSAEKALVLQKQLFGEKDNYFVATTLRTQGIIKYYQGEYERGLVLLEDAIRIRKTLRHTDRIEYVFDLLWLGLVQQEQKKFQAAEESYKVMMENIHRLELNNDLVGVGVTLQASLAFVQGDKQGAELLYQRALNIMSEGSLWRATAEVGLSSMYLFNDEFDLALAGLKRAYQIREKRYPNHHSKIREIALMERVYSSLTDKDKNQLVTLRTEMDRADVYPEFFFRGIRTLLPGQLDRAIEKQ